MNSSEIIGIIEKFFLDIIGTVLPGAALIMGVDYVIGQPLWNNYLKSFLADISIYKLLAILSVSYILGHGITSFGENFTTKWIEYIKSKFPQSALLKKVSSKQQLFDYINDNSLFKTFVHTICKEIPHLATHKEQMRYNDWRNLAMSATQEHSHGVYRFMFLALLNLGIASVLLIMSILLVTLLILNLTLDIDISHYNIYLLVLTFIMPFAFYLFAERYYYFYGIAMSMPLSMAIVKLEIISGDNSRNNIIHYTLPHKEREWNMKVYLAGGFKSGWQDKVTGKFPSMQFFDPSKHNLETSREYTLWDLEAIHSSDCVFAYLEKDNPGGYALALEVGYAKALGKLIIFVDEKSGVDKKIARYLTMIAESSDACFNNLQDGIDYLHQIVDLRRNR